VCHPALDAGSFVPKLFNAPSRFAFGVRLFSGRVGIVSTVPFLEIPFCLVFISPGSPNWTQRGNLFGCAWVFFSVHFFVYVSPLPVLWE